MSDDDYLFVLRPGPPARFGPTGRNNDYQRVGDQTDWPVWGGNYSAPADLQLGNHELGSVGSWCFHSNTYNAGRNQICGCDADATHPNCWGETNMEVWFLVTNAPASEVTSQS